jgi:hypothetical protein
LSMPSPSDCVAKMCNNSTKINGTGRHISSQMFANSTNSVSSSVNASHKVKDNVPFRELCRKKSIHRHRCDRLNQSLTSVLSPSSYQFPKPGRRLHTRRVDCQKRDVTCPFRA